MADSTSNGPVAVVENPTWQEFTGKRAVVKALEGSYASRQGPAVLREADAIIEVVEWLLEPAKPGERVEVYLTDPLFTPTDAASPHGIAPSGVIVRAVQPEAPDTHLAWPIVYLLVERWYGAAAARATLFLDGIAGFASARAGIGASLSENLAWVREALQAGRPLTIFGGDTPAPIDAEATQARDFIATTFVGYLLDAYGPAQLRQFLTNYDPDRRDQAAATAFNRPLGGLEESWRAALSKKASGGAMSTLIGYLVPLLKPYWKREVEVLVLMLLGLSYTLAIPLSGKYLLDTIIPSRNLGHLLIFVVVLVLIYVLNMLIGIRRAYVNNWVNQRVVLQLQERMFAHLQHLSHGFYSTAKVGDVMVRLSEDLYIVQTAMSQVAGVGVYQAMVAIAAAVTLVALGPLLGLFVLLVLPLFLLSFLLIGKRLGAASRRRQQLTGEVAAASQENLSAHAVIKAFSLEERSIEQYHNRLMRLLQAVLRLVIIGSLFEISTVLAVGLGQIVVLGAGGYLVIQGHLTVGTLLAFIGLLPSLFNPISALLQVAETVGSSAGSIDRITELLDEPITIADKSDAVSMAPLTSEIRFDHVDFSYDGDRAILRDFNLIISAGQHVAVVGPSGSGKSTLVNLLMRFWDPTDGQVLFDGHNLKDVTLASLRGQIGLVFQDTFVFDTTLRENIAIGKPEAGEAEIIAAVEAAQLTSYVQGLPNGYDTVLGERGLVMSGGQRQRLAIARALLRNPRILILDEATSALDMQTEREIIATLAELAKGRTTISITHRLSLATMADRIVVLDGGRVIEEGAHQDLVRAGGLYQRLFRDQVDRGSSGELGSGGVRGPQAILERMRAVPLFDGLAEESLRSLAGQVTLEHFEAEEEVVRQGDDGDTLYVIARGSVEVLVRVGTGQRRVNVLNAGDYFGEMALLDDRPRAATVRTLGPAHLYSLTRNDFLALLEQQPAIRDAVAATVAGRRSALNALTQSAALAGVVDE
jgi:ABC-type multidrug transport system fused ATPase/permease subunit